MTKRTALGAGGLALALLAFACGGDSSGGDPAGGAGTGGTSGGTGGGPPGGAGNANATELTELPALMADAYCEVLAGCIPEDLVAAWLGTPDCAALMEKRIENGFLPAAEQARAAGTLAYDPRAIDPCLAAIRAGDCTANQEHPECESALDGTVAEGDDCLHDAECAGDLVCIVDGLCPGQCRERLADGESCTGEDDCREGSVCFESQCASQLGLGDECTEAGVDCEGGLFCAGADADAGTPGTCRPWGEVFSAAAGEACDLTGATLCEPGSVCRVTLVNDALDLTCGPRAQRGGACNLAIPDMCSTGEYCAGLDPDALDLDGTCTPLPGDGSPCAGDRCAGEHVCVAGICLRLKANGADCSVDEECYSEHCTAGVCSPDTDCAL